VALVKLGVFATAGWTEIGGLPLALGRWLPGVELRRELPAAQKPPKRAAGQPLGLRSRAGDKPGLTGPALEREILRRLHRFPKPDLDAILVIDDLDGRLGCDLPRAAERHAAGVARRIRRAMGREIPVFVLYSSPEIEAWFLICWEHGLGAGGLGGACVPGVGDHALRRHLGQAGPIEPDGGWELFGCTQASDERTGSAPPPKLSTALADALARHPAASRPYNKRVDGAATLRDLPLDTLCRRAVVAGPPLRALRRWANDEDIA